MKCVLSIRCLMKEIIVGWVKARRLKLLQWISSSHGDACLEIMNKQISFILLILYILIT